MALACWLWGKTSPARWVLTIGALGVFVECLSFLLPIPVTLAAAVYRQRPLLALSSITGFWCAPFVLWLSNALIARWFLLKKTAWHELGIAAAIVAAYFAVGAGLRAADKADHSSSIIVAGAQEGEGGAASLDRYTLATKAALKGAQLIVFSEESEGSQFDPSDPNTAARKAAKLLHVALVAGFQDGAKPKSHNCAAVIDADGTVRGVSQKHRLFMGEALDIAPGSGLRVFRTSLGKIGAEICFDTNFTSRAREDVGSGAQILAVPTYDMITPGGVLQSLHTAIIAFRAAENGIPIVKVDSYSGSTIFDQHGVAIASASSDNAAVVIHRVGLGNGNGTFYTHFGDWLAVLCGLWCVFEIGSVAFTRLRSSGALSRRQT
jgi:apolipoprotein N-acyltransferase